MGHCPARAGWPHFDIAEIVRQHRAELEAEHWLSVTERRVLTAIARCRTAALGGHVEVCRSCGHEQPAYNSCRNRHCPKCQCLAQERWIGARSERLLPVRHFHVVFTLPSALRALCRRWPRVLFEALFRCASETLLELGQSRLGATLGVTMVLHTWTRDLRFHPHVHAIVTAGGLGHEGDWRHVREYLFPVVVMGQLMRGKMLDRLRQIHRRGGCEHEDPQAFERLLVRLAQTSWLVYAKRPFRRIEHVLGYLGRYTHRVAISNGRLVSITADTVTFRTKEGKTHAVAPVEFLRRFVQHVLPDGFKKIRHYGLYAGSGGAKLEHARSRLTADSARPPVHPPARTWQELLRELTGRDIERCPRCGGVLERISLERRTARGPPLAEAS
ncbi:MAG TPA: IS91 family transposase [Polyangiales bacterium]